MPPIIEVKNFYIALGDKEILKDVSFEVQKGEILFIVGPNGSGKSTLLKSLMRIVTGGRGQIKVNHRLLSHYRQKELAKWISYVPQMDNRIMPFTVYDFVSMGRYPHCSPYASQSEKDKSIVLEALKLTETDGFADRLMHTLSGGEHQRVLIASALAQDTEILLLDEPAAFLDIKHQKDIFNLLKDINKRSGKTIISVTHDINSAAIWGKKLISLQYGRIQFNDVVSNIIQSGILEKIYGTPFKVIHHPTSGTPIALQDYTN